MSCARHSSNTNCTGENLEKYSVHVLQYCDEKCVQVNGLNEARHLFKAGAAQVQTNTCCLRTGLCIFNSKEPYKLHLASIKTHTF